MAEKEYISREEIFKFPVRLNHYDVEALRNFIDNIPAADVAPVKHGEWLEIQTHNGCTPDYDCVCSVCGESGTPNYNYCPNCGAKMDGN